MPTITVDLDDRSYPIYIETGILKNTGFLFSEIRGQHVVILSNVTVAPLYLDGLTQQLEAHKKNVDHIIIEDGESFKTLDSFEFVLSKLLEIPAARDTVIVALGGGVIGDLCGFVAACYVRGIDFIQIPTTLLSQVDSSVGGKTAVNHPLGKNMIGAFYQPQAVYIDTHSLTTLPEREYAAGMAEVIKYGIIYDAEFFTWLNENKQGIKEKKEALLATMISRCCQIKADIVNQDEKEHGVRALLNLGHTFGHAIEAEQGYGNWLHGEAVGAGMVLAAKLSKMRGDISLTQLQDIVSLIEFFDLPVDGPATMTAETYIQHMKRDKKVLSGTMRFILPIGIGSAVVVSDVSTQELTVLLD